ncbi:MAG TPA: hypothetical protein VJB66_02645 [Candidatus Nanoarchaeia archaeon]|nr:hypothetical protein [Candidatus Nanoarchaeia archaeon]
MSVNEIVLKLITLIFACTLAYNVYLGVTQKRMYTGYGIRAPSSWGGQMFEYNERFPRYGKVCFYFYLIVQAMGVLGLLYIVQAI